MAVSIADYREVFTRGLFNNLGEFSDLTAISTRGNWHGISDATPGLKKIIAFKTEVKSTIRLYTEVV